MLYFNTILSKMFWNFCFIYFLLFQIQKGLTWTGDIINDKTVYRPQLRHEHHYEKQQNNQNKEMKFSSSANFKPISNLHIRHMHEILVTTAKPPIGNSHFDTTARKVDEHFYENAWLRQQKINIPFPQEPEDFNKEIKTDDYEEEYEDENDELISQPATYRHKEADKHSQTTTTTEKSRVYYNNFQEGEEDGNEGDDYEVRTLFLLNYLNIFVYFLINVKHLNFYERV